MKKNKKPEIKLFIGSSGETKDLVLLIETQLKKINKISKNKIKIKPIPWWYYFGENPNVFNKTFLDVFLKQIIDECDFGLFVISKDDLIIKRGITKSTARDNVWFESGIFMGKKGLDHTYYFLNMDDFINLEKPSDLNGLTLQGVNWKTDIVNLFFGKSVLFEKHTNVKKEVEKKIVREIKKFCKILYAKIEEEALSPIVSEDALIIRDRKVCYDRGSELIESAKVKLYSSITFKKSLSEDFELGNKMLEALEKKIKENSVSFIRYMDLNNEQIKSQHDYLQNIIDSNDTGSNKSKLINCQFDYLELIISDDQVLMVFPDYRGADNNLIEKVAFGLQIKNNKDLSDILSSWLIKKVGNND